MRKTNSMRVIVIIVGISSFILLCAAFVVLLSWVLSCAIGWLWGFDTFHSFMVAIGALILVAIFAHAMSTQSALEIPWTRKPANENNVIEAEAEAEEISSEPDENWFSPCPCGSHKPFARCCGRRAFKKKEM